MTWEFESSLQARASREGVWSIWSDVVNWPRWNPGVGWVRLDGPVAEGVTGTIRAAGGPASTFEILTVEPSHRLVTQSSERFVRLRFDHELADGEEGKLLITHRVRMTGPGTVFLRHTIGARLRRSIPTALAALAELASAEGMPEAR